MQKRIISSLEQKNWRFDADQPPYNVLLNKTEFFMINDIAHKDKFLSKNIFEAQRGIVPPFKKPLVD